MEPYIKKSDIVAEIERRRNYYKNIQMIKPVYESNIEDFNELLSFLNTLEVKEVEVPVSNTTLLYGLSGSVGIEEAVKETEEYKEWQGDPERQQSFIDFAKFGANYKHNTSKDLEEAANDYAHDIVHDDVFETFIAGALWQKQQLIDKACEWLQNHNDYLRVHDNGRGVRFDITQCVIDFRKAMEEQL